MLFEAAKCLVTDEKLVGFEIENPLLDLGGCLGGCGPEKNFSKEWNGFFWRGDKGPEGEVGRGGIFASELGPESLQILGLELGWRAVALAGGVDGVQLLDAAAEIDVVEIAGVLAENGEGDALDGALAEIGEEVAGDHCPGFGGLGCDEFAAPVGLISAGGEANIPVLLIVQLEHDALGARSLPGEADEAVFIDLGILGDFVGPAGEGALIELHGDDFDGRFAGEEVDGFDAASAALLADHLPDQVFAVIFEELGDGGGTGGSGRGCGEAEHGEERKEEQSRAKGDHLH